MGIENRNDNNNTQKYKKTFFLNTEKFRRILF